MFNSKMISMLQSAAFLLLDIDITTLSNYAIGWTSIPIMNACAVRKDDAKAIALNIRLSTTLHPINSKIFHLESSIQNQNLNESNKILNQIYQLSKYSSSIDFDKILEMVDPYPTRKHLRIGLDRTSTQLLFILLHEYGHIILKHLEDELSWLNHPLNDSEHQFYSATQIKEFQADSFAISKLFQEDKWARARGSHAKPEMPGSEA